MAIVSEYEFRKKVKIAVHLFDENDRPMPTVPWLEKGFRFQPLCPTLKESQIRQDSLLVSHAVFSLLQWQQIDLKREVPASTVMGVPQIQTVLNNEQQASTANTCKSVVVSSSISASSANKFLLNGFSTFTLKMFQSGDLKAEIVIRPDYTFGQSEFMQKLGEFCFGTQQVFGGKIKTVRRRISNYFEIHF
jgi:hypothetical protein